MGKSKDLATGETRFVNTSGDSMTGELLVRRARSNTAGDAALTIHPSDTTVSYGLRIDQNTNSLNFDQVNNNTTKMSIDSSGHVTMPNQPCFSAGGNFGWQDVGSSYGKPTPWRTNQTGQFNSGMWNNSTARATAPVAGRYQFNLNIYTNNSGEYYHYGKLYLNGSPFADTMLHLGDTSNDYPDETISGSFIVNMAANDYVEYYHVEDIYGYHSSFSGFLIG